MDRIRIKSTGAGRTFATGMKVWINDHEIHPAEVSVYFTSHDTPMATITFMPGEIDIDAESLAELVAYVDAKEKEKDGPHDPGAAADPD